MGTHPPPRLGEVLLELLGDGGVDVPLALHARDPAVVQRRPDTQHVSNT